MDGMHVIAGIVLQLAAAAMLRCSVADWRPWLAVLLLEIMNEAYDLLVEQWPQAAMQWGEGTKDVLLTMSLPTLLLLAAKHWPALLAGRQR